MQDDALYSMLTVRENLYYSAMLRLPTHMSHQEKLDRVEEVIQELGLSKCADTKIGNSFFRGVSGGERRRCSIGMELVTRPSILLLDEPTSGLDSKSSRKTIELLKNLAKTKGKTILLTIHQPNSLIFQLFDKVLLLSGGNQIFYGTINGSVAFFDSAGYTVPESTNPSDHFLETINVDFDVANERDNQLKLRQLALAYEATEDHKIMLSEIDQRQIEWEKENSDLNEKKNFSFFSPTQGRKKTSTPFTTQLNYLLRRTFLNNIRDPGVFWIRFILFSFISFNVGTLFLQMGEHDQETVRDRLVSLYFPVCFLCFMSIGGLPAFLIEKEIFIRERRNGYYTVLPFALSHSMIAVIYLSIVGVCYSAICYFAMNYNQETDRFFYFALIISLILMCAEGMAMMISAVAPGFIAGLALASAVYGAFMLMGGLVISADNIPNYWKWFSYTVLHKYAYEGLMVNEFSGSFFYCDEVMDDTTGKKTCQCLSPDYSGDCIISGEEVLRVWGFEDVPKWEWVAVLIAIAVFYHFGFYLCLRFFNTGER